MRQDGSLKKKMGRKRVVKECEIGVMIPEVWMYIRIAWNDV
jgi:hypothetical protein